MPQIHDYKTLEYLGRVTKLPIRYQAAQVHVIYDVKLDLYHQARLVSGCHMTEVPNNRNLFKCCMTPKYENCNTDFSYMLAKWEFIS